MRLWPTSLFGRLSLVLLAVVVVTLVVTIALFRQDRAALLARQFADNRVAELQALRAALAAVDPDERRDTVNRIGREYGVRIVAEEDRPAVGSPPLGPALTELQYRLRTALGNGTVVRVQPRLQLVWVRIAAGGAGYWVAFPLPVRQPAEDASSRAVIWSITVAVCLLLAAFLFARYLGKPLRDLNGALMAVGRGRPPEPLPETGPSEIANLNRGFNRMLADLRQLEHERALLLAGVSHDLRTPLARLRLGLELSGTDDAARRGMTDDIEEMDRIIGQFLDFARSEHEAPGVPQDPNALVAAAIERYDRGGKDVRFTPGAVSAVALRATAFGRLVANLVDNALAYGAPPVEVRTHATSALFTLDVLDRGPGIPPGEAERLKQPFTRASVARAHVTGVAGAGLGLAIVERIARVHGGSVALLPREGGGTIARVTLPLRTGAPA